MVEGYVEGAPELIAEIAASSVSYDLHDKLNAYRRNCVREYVVWRVWDRVIDWFVLREGRYVPLEAEDGVYRSEVFPGLWLNAAAVLSGNLPQAVELLQEGLDSDPHRDFVRQIENRIKN